MLSSFQPGRLSLQSRNPAVERGVVPVGEVSRRPAQTPESEKSDAPRAGRRRLRLVVLFDPNPVVNYGWHAKPFVARSSE